MRIGDKVKLKELARCLSPIGAYTYIDPPIDVEGMVIQTAEFVNKRVCIEFLINFQKHTVWKYEDEVTKSGENRKG